MRCYANVVAPPTPSHDSSQQVQQEGLPTQQGTCACVWDLFADCRRRSSPAEQSRPPEWFEQLCLDLYQRTNVKDDQDELARDGIIDGAPERFDFDASKDTTVDPFLWLPFDLRDEKDYIIGPYQFPEGSPYDDETKNKLALSDVNRTYVCFCDAYPFPDRRQLPTSVGTEPCHLWVSPQSATPTVYLQLSPLFPPLMWIPVKPTASAVRHVLAEFATVAAAHRDSYHIEWEEKIEKAKQRMEQQSIASDDASVLRYLGAMSREVLYFQAPTREFPNFQVMFLGEYDNPETLMEHMDLCPLRVRHSSHAYCCAADGPKNGSHSGRYGGGDVYVPAGLLQSAAVAGGAPVHGGQAATARSRRV